MTFDRHIVGPPLPRGLRTDIRPASRSAGRAEGRGAGAEVQRPGAAVDARPGDDRSTCSGCRFPSTCYCVDALKT